VDEAGRERFIKAARETFPGAFVWFDSEAPIEWLRFKLLLPDGRTNLGFAAIEDWRMELMTDLELGDTIREQCGTLTSFEKA
jgi:hypothetical protein